jgi:hypothetical protein
VSFSLGGARLAERHRVTYRRLDTATEGREHDAGETLHTSLLVDRLGCHRSGGHLADGTP